MKKIIAILLICLAANTAIKAQYVNIPDTSFGKFLLAQYPSCLYKDASNLYWMDTTCSGVVNETSLFCAFKNVKNLDGVQYFKRVKTLYCANNPITTIPSLPDSVTTFSCFNDSLVSLPSLPNGLKQLNCYNNKLASLPVLSDSLLSIDCHNNSITILPAIPNKLQTLYCSKNSLGGLPALPTSLFTLDCSTNPIGSLPTLPIHLLRLICNADSLNSLPPLPSSLDWLECSINMIDSLPALPTYLSYLGCSYNQLTSIPTIYNTLDSIKCDHNLLTSLPTLTHALRLIDCSDNANLGCLPKLPSLLKKLNVVNTQINCLPNVINGLITIPSLPYCNPTNNANQCQAFPTLQGKVFTDNNSNGVKDTLEFYRPFIKLSLNNGQTTLSNLTGSYNINIDTLGSFTLKVTPPPYYKAVPDSVNFSFSAGTTLLVLPDIVLQPIAAKDSIAAVVTTLYHSAVPGLNLAYNIVYGNAGTTNLKPTVNFSFDSSRLIFDSSSVAITSNSGNVISVSSDSLFAGQIKYFNLYFRVKTTAVLGDSIAALLNIAAANTIATAINVVVVHSSFDPNDKQATPTLTPQQVANGEYIDYVVRFQNTGNANAINIVIADTLSNLLQFNNIQVVSSSNNSNIGYSVGNGIIYFQFLNINLPFSSANEPLSHGFVRFRVKALPTLALGAIVPNKASIYFDYNTPIVTNTATTQVKAVIVPVRIISYTIAANEKREIRNDWKVGVEINVSHYIVQRSINGKDFMGVGEVAAQALNSYSFTDKVSNDILQNIIYYRLKVIDKDGMFTYSDVKEISRNEKRETISMYPNPARDIVNIDVLGGKQLSIINYLGKEVVLQSVVNKQQISISNLAKGVYMVKLIMNNGEIKTNKLIVE